MSTAGPEAAELAAGCGFLVDPFQQLFLDECLGENDAGWWSAPDVVEIASRQNGKNGGLEVRELFGLVMLGEWIIHTSHLFTTTKESYNRLFELVEADPEIKDRLIYRVGSPAVGYEMRFRGGGRIKFIARSRTSGRGLTGDLLVFDEAQDLEDEAQGALLPVTSARSQYDEARETSRQIIYMGSAPGPKSTVLHRWRRLGRAGAASGLLYLEFSADPASDLDDRDAWAQANPALGVRISERAIESERQSMSDEMFARERLSISPDIDDDSDIGLPFDRWDSLTTPCDLQGPRSVAVAVSMDRSRATVSVCGTNPQGLPYLDVVEAGVGTTWVVERLRTLGLAPVVLDAAGPAGSLVADLTKAGIEVKPVSGREYGGACGALFDAVIEGRVRHSGAQPLTDAVKVARRKDRGDVWVWHRTPNDDVSPLEAANLAFWAHTGTATVDYQPLVAWR